MALILNLIVVALTMFSQYSVVVQSSRGEIQVADLTSNLHKNYLHRLNLILSESYADR